MAQPALTPHNVEMAVRVHPDHRCCGLERRLLRQVLSDAAAQGQEVAHFFAFESRPILAPVRHLGACIAASFGRAELQLGAFEPPTPPSLISLLSQGSHGSVRGVAVHPKICETSAP